MPALSAHARFWPAIAAVILIACMLRPPAAGYARRNAFAQALLAARLALTGHPMISAAGAGIAAAGTRGGTSS